MLTLEEPLSSPVNLKTRWRLGILMLDRGLRDEEIANLMGKHPCTIGRWRRLEEPYPVVGRAEIMLLAQILHCKEQELWQDWQDLGVSLSAA